MSSLCPAACRAICAASLHSISSKWCCSPRPAGTHRINHPAPWCIGTLRNGISPNVSRPKRSRSRDVTVKLCAKVAAGTNVPLSLSMKATNGSEINREYEREREREQNKFKKNIKI